MQVQIFILREFDRESVEECNRFLRSHKIVSVQEEFVSSTGCWHVFVKFLGESSNPRSKEYERKDYKDILDEKEFVRFAKLRDVRKVMAAELTIPAYMIFTNEELAELAKIDVLDASNLKTVHGIGGKRVEKYGVQFLDRLSKFGME